MRRAFSLIELLIVIAIVGILAGMLMPALSTVRALAKQAACGSHLGQLSMAAISYATDQRGLVVAYWSPSLNQHWTIHLAPYLEQTWAWYQPRNRLVKQYRCPGDGGGDNSPYLRSDAATLGYWVTYGIHQMASCYYAGAHWGKYGELTLRTVKDRGRFALFGDMNCKAWSQSINTDWATMTSFRHRGRMQSGFLDGHVGSDTPTTYGTTWWDSYNVTPAN
ncbi:MAG: type II secretion system GspH family protein [Planctomycetes bacterium]|nr:type II secretion system GspH family protein [Planctomycetota bacterium]